MRARFNAAQNPTFPRKSLLVLIVALLISGRTYAASSSDAAGEPRANDDVPSRANDKSPLRGNDETIPYADEGVLPPAEFLPLACNAEQTGGFHDYPDDDQSYVPALFNSTPFRLEENRVFMLNLGRQPGVDLFVSLTSGEDPVTTELECRAVRGVDGSSGYSCVNIPPSEMLLINGKTLRFTRTAVGGWTFAGATETQSGDSVFVEYGTCTPGPPR